MLSLLRDCFEMFCSGFSIQISSLFFTKIISEDVKIINNFDG